MPFQFINPVGSLTTVASYTTAAGLGTTRVIGAVTATTITTNSTNVAPYGWATTANFAAHTSAHAAIVADLTAIKGVLNALVNDLKAWGLST